MVYVGIIAISCKFACKLQAVDALRRIAAQSVSVIYIADNYAAVACLQQRYDNGVVLSKLEQDMHYDSDLRFVVGTPA